jgi:hypothetical protein
MYGVEIVLYLCYKKGLNTGCDYIDVFEICDSSGHRQCQSNSIAAAGGKYLAEHVEDEKAKSQSKPK